MFRGGLVLGVSFLGLFGWSGDGNHTDEVTDKFPLPTAGRTIKVGLYGSLAFGLAQDALGLARGRRLRYIDFLMGKTRDDSGMEAAVS